MCLKIFLPAVHFHQKLPSKPHATVQLHQPISLYPSFDNRFACQIRYEPSPEFPLALPYSGINHTFVCIWQDALLLFCWCSCRQLICHVTVLPTSSLRNDSSTADAMGWTWKPSVHNKLWRSHSIRISTRLLIRHGDCRDPHKVTGAFQKMVMSKAWSTS